MREPASCRASVNAFEPFRKFYQSRRYFCAEFSGAAGDLTRKSTRRGSRMKVLFITRKWPPAVGGMELYSREIAAAMSRYAEIDIEALPGRRDGRPPSAAALFLFFVRASFALAIRGHRYDVIHFGDFVLFPLAVWSAIVAPRTRKIVTVHGLDLIYGQRRGVLPFVYRLYVHGARALQHVVDCFVANSAATAEVAKALGFRRVSAVPLGIALPEKAPAPTAIDAARQAAARGKDKYILFVGRIVPRKRLAWFAENVLPRLDDGVSLKIVGAAWDQKELARALENSRAKYLGRVDDSELQRLREGAAVTVMPNLNLNDGDMEGFGLAALEAAASGSLLVASNVEGIVDAVVDKETGFLAKGGDADDWVEKVSKLLAWSPNERARFLANARDVIEKWYSWDRVARETLALATGRTP